MWKKSLFLPEHLSSNSAPGVLQVTVKFLPGHVYVTACLYDTAVVLSVSAAWLSISAREQVPAIGADYLANRGILINKPTSTVSKRIQARIYVKLH